MSVAAVGPASSQTATLRSLTQRELIRMAASPLLLVAMAATPVGLVSALRSPLTNPDGLGGTVGTLIGGFSLIAAFWLTTSTRRSESSLAVTPTSASTRTAALCLTTLVPFAAGLLSFCAVEIFQRIGPGSPYGVLSPTDRAVMVFSQLVLPSIGGPLLGIALARWFPGPWVPVAAFLVIIAWLLVVEGLASTYQNSTPVLWLRLFAPFALFLSSGQAKGVETWRGSVGWFVAWQVALCLLALTVALLRTPNLAQRRRLLLALGVIVVVAVACYVLAATGGVPHAVVTDPSGHTTAL